MERIEAIRRAMEAAGQLTPESEAANQGTIIAGQMLDRTTKDILGRGWHFNTRKDVVLTPQPDSTIPLPDGAITIDSYGASASKNIAQVGRTLYDLDNNTDEFADAVRVTYTLLFEFDCLPEPVATYIAEEVAVAYNAKYGHRWQERDGENRMKRDKAKAAANRWNEQSSDRGAMSSRQRRNVLGGRLDNYGYIR